MDTPGLVVLVLGIMAVVAASAGVLRQRRARGGGEPEGAPSPASHAEGTGPAGGPPIGLTPGMVGTLLTGTTTNRDVLITLVDLAQRGFLRITAAARPGLPAHDWVLTRTGQGVEGAGLHGFERFLLDRFPSGEDDSVTLSGIITAPGRTLPRVRGQLHEDTVERDWFVRGPARANHWGWAGALVLLAGLVLAVWGVIEAMATGRWAVLLGAVLLAVAGLELASLGRLSGTHTPEEPSTSEEALAYRREMASWDPERIRVEELPGILHDPLVYALAFGDTERLSRLTGRLSERAGREGMRVDLDLGWFRTPGGDPPVTSFIAAVAGFVDAGSRLADEHHENP